MSDSAVSRARRSAARIFRNAGSLLIGQAAAGVFSIVYLAIAARSLGPAGVGALVLVHAYALLVAGLARFQSWQAVIRFGAPMLAAGDTERLKDLLRYTIRLDIMSGVAAALIAAAAAPFVARMLDWSDDVLRLAYFYSFAVPFLIAATPTGVLRLFDRFRLLGWQQIIMPGLRCAGAVLLWIMNLGLEAFILLWLVSAVSHGATLWVFGFKEMGKQNLTPRILGKQEQRADKAWLPFMIKTNLSSSITLVHENAPLLIVGGVLGAGAAGFLKIAINLTNILAKPIAMLNQAVFPELSKIEANAGRAQMLGVCMRAVLDALAVAAPFVAVLIFFRRDLAQLVGGYEFLPAAPLIALMALAQPLQIAALSLSSATLARGRAGWELTAQAIAAAAHLAFLALMLSAMGVIAAPLALMAGWGVLIVVLLVAVLR